LEEQQLKIEKDDRVVWCGAKGYIVSTTSQFCEGYPVVACFEDTDSFVYFTEDGRYFNWQQPSLLVVKKAKEQI